MDISAAQEELDRAYQGLEEVVPDWVARVLRWLRDPNARLIRIPLGLLLIGLSFFWYLPIIGMEFMPIGLLLIAQDVPFLQKPVARMLIWLERRWVALRYWWQRFYWKRLSVSESPPPSRFKTAAGRKALARRGRS